MAVLGSSFFLFLGAFVQLNIIPFAMESLHLTDIQGGYLFLLTAIGIGTRLLDKPGGYLGNDLFPPGVWLDDIANWEFGALTQLRDLTEAMRESFSRSQSQSAEDRDLVIAEPQFKFDNASWALPSTEGEYRQGLRALRSYLQRIWTMVLEESFLRGLLAIPAGALGFYEAMRAWCAAVWTRPPRGNIDPVKEREAEQRGLDNLTETRTAICHSRGQDWDAVLRTRAREDRAIRKAGLAVPASAPTQPEVPQEQEQPHEEDSTA